MTTVAIDPRVRERRAALLRRRGRRRLRVLGLLAAVGVAVGLAYLVSRSPLLDVERVRVEGATRTPAEQILAAAEIEPGTPLLDADLGAAREAVSWLPWVESVSSQRSWRGTITLVVTERSPVATMAGAGGWFLVDRTGRVLDIVPDRPGGLVVVAVSGVRRDPGQWLPRELDQAIEAASELPEGLAARVTSLTPSDGVELELGSGGRIRLGGTDDLDAKYLAALTVLARVDTSCLATIDVQVPTAPVLTRTPLCP